MTPLKNRSSVAHLKPWISLKTLNRTLATSAALISIYFLIKIKHVLNALHNSVIVFSWCCISDLGKGQWTNELSSHLQLH